MEIRALFCSLLIALAAFGQVSTSRLTGTIQDASGAVVAGATIMLQHEATGVVRTTTTTDAGTYTFDAIPTGFYTVEVEAKGFKKTVLRRNEVNIGAPTTVNATLEVGALTDTVDVSGAAELVQTSTSGNYGNVLTEKILRDMPIVGTRGRNPLTLVLLQPGTNDGANTGGGYHVHGSRDRAWNFTLDGIDNNDPSAGGSNFAPTRTNPDALSELRVVTSNPTADVGRNSGGNVLLVTKSGTNEFHGSAFWFYRTPRLNANEWSQNFNRLGKRQFVQNIYGGSIGGPIWRNKTFFFGNLQRLAASETRTVNRLVYTEQARRGLLRYVAGGRNRPAGQAGASVDAAGNPLPGLTIGTYNVVASDPQRIGLDGTIQAAVAETPLPNNFSGGDGLNTAYFTWTAPVNEKQQDNNMIRIDHFFNEKHSVFGRGSWGYQNSVCDAANAGTAFFPGSGCNVDTRRDPKNIAASWRYILSPSVINEFTFGHSEFTFDFISPQAQPGQIFFQGGDGGGTVTNNLGAGDAPVIVRNLSYAIGNLRTIRTRQFVDNLTWIRSAHTFKGGFNLRFVQHADIRGSIGGANANTTVNFNPAINRVDTAAFGIPADLNVQFDRPEFERNINFLLGRVGRITRGFASNGERYVEDLYRVRARYGEMEFYIQDTWKARRNLTIDLGLRWELRNEPGEANDLIARPNQPLVYGAPTTITARWERGPFYTKDWNNLGPSIGIAWDPFGAGKTSVRSNYRIAYDRLPTFGLSTIFQTLPGITLGVTNDEFGQNGGRLPNLPQINPPNVSPSSLAQPASYSNNTITVVDPNLETATTHMWAFGIQHEVLRRTVLSVDYIGRRAHNLYGAYNANQPEIFRNGFLEAFNRAKAGGESALLDRLTRPDTRRTAAESGAAFIRRQFPTELALNSAGSVALNLGQRIQNGVNLPELSGLGSNFFYPFPQFGQVRVIDSNDFSTYHGLEVQLLRRFANGVEAQFSWTWSKSLDTRSYDPSLTIYGTGSQQSATSQPFDVANRKLNYARSDFDRRHIINSYWIWELPFGRNRRFGASVPGIVDAVLGGWQVAGFLRYQTGRPFTVFSGQNTLSSVFQSTAQCNGCSPDEGRVFTNAAGFVQFFDDATRSKLTLTPAGEIGNTGRNFFNLAPTFNVDASLSKRFYFTESINFEIRADSTNLTNTPVWDVPTAVRTSGSFGAFTGPLEATGSRKMQLGAKFNF